MTPQNLLLFPLTAPKLSIGCPILDACLGSGIPYNTITELVGESSSGKTQLCLQLTVQAQLPHGHGGLGGSSLYIYTEFSFSFRRLQQLAKVYQASHPNLIGVNPLEDIYVHVVDDAQQLIHVLENMETCKLKALANKFGVAMLLTNQIVDFIGPDDGINGVRLGNLECLHTSGRRVSPALGLAWAHCVNSRVFLSTHEHFVGGEHS
ncbi:unnamed protein product [Prunus armeniaca]|uniref:RecA family profile 1 domain-containing protein n=1 Tax=Prunus armeniaca TaxID=36596 RepID=A0A6J5UA54_PRUAR|nr:unnamed protein product [Prunus armeniaca]